MSIYGNGFPADVEQKNLTKKFGPFLKAFGTLK